MNKKFYAKVAKVDASLGLVFGHAIVCLEKGEPYFDVQGDHIPESVMMKEATDFMMESRVAKEMHEGEQNGVIVFAWPMTTEVAKAFDIKIEKTGLLIAMKPANNEILEKFNNGTFTGFSIGGFRIEDIEVEEDD